MSKAIPRRFARVKAALRTQVRQVAWSYRNPDADLAEPDDLSGTAEQRRAGALELLALYRVMSVVLDELTERAVTQALSLGASFGDVGQARGISRQAARQRILRASPRASSRFYMTGHGAEVDRSSGGLAPEPADNRPHGKDSVAKAAVVAIINAADVPDRTSGKIRVRELATELGISSSEVMTRLREMGEYVRTASSTIEAPVARHLREGHKRNGH